MTLKATLVIPCYNEAQRLPQQSFLDFVEKYDFFNFLFVDDGSHDATSEVLKGLASKKPNRFRVLILEKNGGKAEAVRRGILEALKEEAAWLGFWDADLATPLEVLPEFMALAELFPPLEIIMGSRVKLLGHDIQRSPLRHYLGRIFATAASMVLDLAVYDTQCGAKMFKVTPQLKDIFFQPFGSRWIFDVEILARFKKIRRLSHHEAEAYIYEMPLPTWKDVAGSKVKPSDFFKAFGELVRIYWNYR